MAHTEVINQKNNNKNNKKQQQHRRPIVDARNFLLAAQDEVLPKFLHWYSEHNRQDIADKELE